MGVENIETCQAIENRPNFNEGEHYESSDYIWYKPKTPEEVDTLNAAYPLSEKLPYKIIGRWICIEVSEDGTDAWCSTIDDGIEYAKYILDKLGYYMEVRVKLIDERQL